MQEPFIKCFIVLNKIGVNKNRVNAMNKKLGIIVIAVCGGLKLSAQSPVFMMSSIGSMAGTSSSVSALNFKSNAACLDVQNGIAVLNGKRNTGTFAMSCEVTLKINTLGVKLFPNPVNSVTKVKITNVPPLNETFNLSIWTTEGAMISTSKETGYNLFQGMTMDLSRLVAGSYVLKIESSNFIDAIKFIKAN